MFDGNYLRIRDIAQLEIVPKKENLKDVFSVGTGTNGQVNELFVKFAATHAGIITRNNTYYLPDLMRDSAHTFLDGFPKPILLHHDETKDAIGRAATVQYVDLSHVVKAQYIGDKFKDSLIDTSFGKIVDDFCLGQLSFEQKLDTVINIFNQPILKDGQSILSDANFAGLGFVELGAKITDPDAIQKFLDGRYLTGSVGATTDKAVCCICKQDWTKAGPCKHKPGAAYDSKKMFLIAGKFIYDEYSVANLPADKGSKALELYFNGQKQEIAFNNEIQDSVCEIKSIEKKEDKGMGDEIKDTKVAPVAPVESLKVESAVNANVVVKDELPKTETPTVAAEDVIVQLMDAKALTEEDEIKFYDLLWAEVEAAAIAGELSLAEVKDAKLSAESRKKMASSTFCGPNRSFPVPDCAHVVAARRLIGKYKGPGDKSSILACVARKAKALGCSSAKTKDNMSHARVLHMLTSVLEENMYSKMGTEDKEPTLTEDDVKTLTSVLENVVKLVGKDNLANVLCGDKLALTSFVKRYQDLALLDVIIGLEEKLGSEKEQVQKLQESNVALREEYAVLQQEGEKLRDALVQEKVQVRQSKISYLSLLMNLKDGAIVDRNAELTKLSDEVLDGELVKFERDVDMQKITDKLSNGLTKSPVEKVEDPTVLHDIKKKEFNEIEVKKTLDVIRNNYFILRMRSLETAENYLKNQMEQLQKEGKLPEDK